jgi:molecular chaperone DnaK (HSP70)
MITSRVDISSLPVEMHDRALPNTARHGVGIDLGTTNSVIASSEWNPSDPVAFSVRCLEVEQPTDDLGVNIGALVPSVVGLTGGKAFVGEGAKRLVAKGASSGLRRNRDFFFETKNEMGTDRRYAQAAEGYRTPGEIGGHILRFLMDAATAAPDAIVVTVPASFQVAQRHETVAAAAYAGFDLLKTQLLDEPVAAFIDFATTRPASETLPPGSSRNVLVFDFGGGTCDIAVLSLTRAESGQLAVAPRSISRFHRLGGGDIDAAIVYDVLIPQLLEQNKLPPRSFGFAEKRNQIEPALRPIAEGLKIGLSQEQARRARLGLSPDPELKRQFPGRHSITVNGKVFELTTPVLTAKAFSAVLQPFFDRNMLAPRSDEYRTARSIFAPIEDAIERSGMTHDEIDLCLTVGGSSNIPLVTEALRGLLPRAQVITYEDAEARKTCVARGAAIAAAFTAVTGQRLITSVSFDEIALRTQDGNRVLVPAGQPLPFPSSGETDQVELRAPQASVEAALPLRVAIVAGREQRTLFDAIWNLAAPVRAGEPLTVQFRFDGNQVLHLGLLRAERPDQPQLNAKIESPLTHVQNPIAKEIEAEKLEREIGSGRLSPVERRLKARELAGLLDELGQREKALATLRALQAQQRAPDAGILNSMALIVEKLGDHEEACRLFEEAAEANPDWDAALFNLALKCRSRGKPEEARHAIERALQRDKTGPSLTLKALIAKDAGDETQKKASLLAASSAWPPRRGMQEWMLYWYTVWAQESGDDAALRAAENERERRRRTHPPAGSEGVLPMAGERDT